MNNRLFNLNVHSLAFYIMNSKQIFVIFVMNKIPFNIHKSFKNIPNRVCQNNSKSFENPNGICKLIKKIPLGFINHSKYPIGIGYPTFIPDWIRIRYSFSEMWYEIKNRGRLFLKQNFQIKFQKKKKEELYFTQCDGDVTTTVLLILN